MSDKTQLCRMFLRKGPYGEFYSGSLGLGNVTLNKSKNGDWYNLQIRPKEDETQQPGEEKQTAVKPPQSPDEWGV